MRITLLIWLGVLSSLALSQGVPKFINYSVDNGLPSPESYHVIQDSQGYIWISTDNGVVRFNGRTFEHFSIADGMLDNTIFEMFEDEKGRVWLASYSNKICYFNNGKFHPYEYNHIIEEHCDGWIKSTFYADKDDNLYLGSLQHGMIQIDNKGNHKFEHNTDINRSIGFIIQDDHLLQFGYSSVYAHMDSSKINTNLIMLNGKWIDTLVLSGRRYQSSARISKDIIMLTCEKDLFLINNQEVIYHEKLDHDVISLQTIDSELWVGFLGHGALAYTWNNNKLKKSREPCLVNKSVSSIYKDSEGGFWFSTLEQGVFYTPNIEIQSLTETEGLGFNEALSISGNENNAIYIGHRNSYLSIIKDRIVQNLHIDISGSDTPITEIVYINFLNEVILTSLRPHVFITEDLSIKKKESDKHITIEACTKLDDSTIVVAGFQGLMKFKKGEDIQYFYNKLHHSKLSCMEYFDSMLYVGSIDGLFTINPNEMENSGLKKTTIETKINAITSTTDYLILGTSDHGLILLNKSDTMQVDIKDGLLDNDIRSLKYSDKKLYVGTNKGLNIIEATDTKYLIKNLTTKDGLLSNRVNDIYADEEHIWIAGNNGVNYFQKDLSLDKDSPRLLLQETKINNSIINTSSPQLSYSDNNLKFLFDAISFYGMDDIEYRYRLMPNESSFTTTSSNVVSYSNLSHGTYTLEAQTRVQHGKWSPRLMYEFSIAKPFWLKSWFIVIAIIGFLGVIYLLFRWRVRYVTLKEQKRKQIENEILNARLQAIRSQLNPHFTLNSLNSILNYIGNHDVEAATNYLTKFSKLIRGVYMNSRKQSIILSEEIDMLEMYLQLESMRFEGELDYEINVAQDVDVDFERVPPMVIQPIVENAIIHGIRNNHESGKVVIDFKIEDDLLRCVITDNGVGREAARKIAQEKGVQSSGTGLDLVKRRLALDDEIDGDVLLIEDVMDGEKVSGSRVTIIIKKKA